MNKEFSKELITLIAICNHSINESKNQDSLSNIKWGQMVSLAKHHRIGTQLYKRIVELDLEIPIRVKEQLAKESKNSIVRMLKFSAEIAFLTNLFTSKSINSIFLKGPIAAKQIFDDFTAKNSRDIDLLIPENSIEDCIELLLNNDYKITYPFLELNFKQKSYFKKVNNQLAFFHTVKKIQIEIHWRLFANPHLLPLTFDTLQKKSKKITLGNETVSGLGLEHLLIYHCTHGAKHKWEKLYWLIEVSTLILKNPNLLKTALPIAKNLNCVRPILQAIKLSNRLLNTNFKFEEKLYLENRIEVNELVEIALNAIQFQTVKSTNFSYSSFSKKSNYTKLLKDDYGYRAAQKKLLSVNDFQIINLPEPFFWLYYPLRPFIFCWRIINGKK